VSSKRRISIALEPHSSFITQGFGLHLLVENFKEIEGLNLTMKQRCAMIAFALIGASLSEFSAVSTRKLVGGAQTAASLTEPGLEEIHISEDQLPDDKQHMVQRPAAPDQSKTGKRQKNRRKYSPGTTFAMSVLGAAALIPSGPRAAVYASL